MGKQQYTALDLFAGAGGLSEGLHAAGFTTIYANEVVPRYAQTFKANHPQALVEGQDIRLVDAKKVRRELGLKKGELDLVAGGPPCQGFSINAPKRCSRDVRNHLFRDFLRFVEEFEPKSVLVENVPGLVSYEGGGTLQAILDALKKLGYASDVRILYAPHFGIPQTRWRTIIVGFKRATFPEGGFPDHKNDAPHRINFTSSFGGRNIVSLPYGGPLPSHVTVRDAIGDLPKVGNGAGAFDYDQSPSSDYQRAMRIGSVDLTSHTAPRLSKINLERLKHIPPGGSWTSIPFKLLPEGMKKARQTDHTKRYGRVSPDGLASTILTKCDPHWGAYFHYEQDRVFTVREAARLQSFPDRYVFLGSQSEQYQQVGNAVPPLLAAAVGGAIIRTVESQKPVSQRKAEKK